MVQREKRYGAVAGTSPVQTGAKVISQQKLLPEPPRCIWCMWRRNSPVTETFAGTTPVHLVHVAQKFLRRGGANG